MVSFGSLAEGIAYVKGYALYVETPELSAGHVPAGKLGEVSFPIKNLSNRAITVIGAREDCGCLATEDLPLVVPPRETSSIRVRFAAPQRDVGRDVKHLVLLYLDRNHPLICLTVKAEIVEPLDDSTLHRTRGPDGFAVPSCLDIVSR